MNKVKIKDIKTGAVKEVAKSLASDFIGTGRFILVEEKKQVNLKTSFVDKVEETKQDNLKKSFIESKEK